MAAPEGRRKAGQDTSDPITALGAGVRLSPLPAWRPRLSSSRRAREKSGRGGRGRDAHAVARALGRRPKAVVGGGASRLEPAQSFSSAPRYYGGGPFPSDAVLLCVLVLSCPCEGGVSQGTKEGNVSHIEERQTTRGFWRVWHRGWWAMHAIESKLFLALWLSSPEVGDI